MTLATLPAPSRHLGQRFADVLVLTGRNLVHIAREPLQLSDVTIQPVLFTLLFVYVFGSGVVLPGGGSYKEFAIAGLLALNITTSAMGTAVGLSTDLNTGVIDRFRTLPMWRAAVLVGRSAADLSTAALCTLIVAVTGLVIGWRPHEKGGFCTYCPQTENFQTIADTHLQPKVYPEIDTKCTYSQSAHPPENGDHQVQFAECMHPANPLLTTETRKRPGISVVVFSKVRMTGSQGNHIPQGIENSFAKVWMPMYRDENDERFNDDSCSGAD